MKKFIIIILSVFAFVLPGIVGHAFGTQGQYKDALAATPEHPDASGTLVITDTSIAIEAKGLKSNSVYTAWFVNTKPKKHEAGAGEPPYMFKTDAQGNGAYSANLNASPLGRWQMVMVVLHPTGDPKDMKHMVGALSARLP